MWVRALSLTDFRSYPQVDVELAPGVTTFLGRNGQGKTNLIEALGFLSTLESHRVAGDAPLVRHGAPLAVIRGRLAGEREVTLEVAITPGKANRGRVNGAAVPRVREILGHLRTVLFAPEDLALVKGDPSDRRRFLDDLLIQRTPRLAGVRADFDRVLKQRNALLKSAGVARRRAEDEMLRTLEVWDAQLIEHGAPIIAARIGLLDELREPARSQLAIIAGDDEARLDLQYVSSLGDSAPTTADVDAWTQALADAITRRRSDELDRGLTLIGPQRDDVLITLGDMPAKGYASHGESWSIALALRLAAFDILREDGIDPVLILDDVFAELDHPRRERLAGQVQSATQVLITAAVDADVPSELAGARFIVADGAVMPG